jgi:hypothetical protein
MRSVPFFLIVSLLGTSALATTPPPEFILLPVVVSHARDATGAYWSTTVSFVYGGTAPVDVVNEGNLGLRLLQPGEQGELTLNMDGQRGPGMIIESRYPASQQLFVQSHVFNEAAPETGAILPSVRLHDLTVDQPVRLIGIPIGSSSRTLLRIYDMSMQGDIDARVKVRDASGGLLVSDAVHLAAPPLRPLQSFATEPAYAEYRPNVDLSVHSSLSIDIEPVTTNTLLWAFTTTTDERSRSVAAVFPAK